MSIEERTIRASLENLLGSTSSNAVYNVCPSPHISHSVSINSPGDFLLSESVITGARQGGRMSIVRRFFCLFVTFDLLFTILMWLICIMLMGDNIFDALRQQIVHYNIHTSLFDIVMAACCRFTFLLLFYGLLYIRHWFIIAFTTSVTCAFLIAKVFVYNWTGADQPVFEVLLILISFVLSWGEAWFLDFRVLPQELQANTYMNAYLSTVEANERTPLLQNYLQRLPIPTECNESVGNFYSPMISPEGSDDEGEPSRAARKPSINQDADFRTKAKEIFDLSWRIFKTSDWKLEKNITTDSFIESHNHAHYGKIFKLTATVNFPPKFILNELFHKINQVHKWNPALKDSKRIHYIDEFTDIVYTASCEGGGGIVSSRDFVDLRIWSKLDGGYVCASASIPHSSVPPSVKFVRGENGPSCFVVTPLADDENRCLFQFMVNTNLRGWIPQYVIDSSLTSTLVDYLSYLNKYSLRLHEEGVLPLTQPQP